MDVLLIKGNIDLLMSLVLFCCSYLLGLLANEGYLIISVPYNVTFDHSRASSEIYERFFGCFDGILATGLPDFALTSTDLVDLPVFCVGHR